ncbi:methionine ABC transporter ATP-binding protein [Paenibacillus wulumuqiensis]|uniref:methionine ABC transporter ATP-binding protein n=1 Tax=Paenibacillus wulumuqiensis TaxID=1567107 RepID=UPI000698E52B|nr:methionine ABC transporter ATP-binding protein [Paenibacillus wulumuqiensis]
MIALQGVSKYFSRIDGGQAAVDEVTLHIQAGDIHGIVGSSGAGKSTLLRMINMLERPDQGSVTVNGERLTGLPERRLRPARQQIGMIFQQFNLVHNRTVGGNVAVPLELAGIPKDRRQARVRECLEQVGLLDKLDEYPAQLSGGQKQRVAIARAIANHPRVLLCDEPTSALDPKSTSGILELLQQINEQLGVTIVIVTHEMDVVKRLCNTVSVMERGRITESYSREQDHFAPAPDYTLSYREQLLGRSDDAVSPGTETAADPQDGVNGNG